MTEAGAKAAIKALKQGQDSFPAMYLAMRARDPRHAPRLRDVRMVMGDGATRLLSIAGCQIDGDGLISVRVHCPRTFEDIDRIQAREIDECRAQIQAQATCVAALVAEIDETVAERDTAHKRILALKEELAVAQKRLAERDVSLHRALGRR